MNAKNARILSLQSIRDANTKDIDIINEGILKAANDAKLNVRIDSVYSNQKELLEYFVELGYTVSVSTNQAGIPTGVVIGW